jgi:hypothetical protein
MEHAPTTAQLGDLYRRRAIAEAVARLESDERAATELHHRHGVALDEIDRWLDLAPERSVEIVMAAHRHLVGALPWLVGSHRCTEARAALLAGSGRADDIDHIRHCTACQGVDLLAVQTALCHAAAWDGTWLADEVYWVGRDVGPPAVEPGQPT